jgi:anaerobic magnesium-protoporphyrin IX monomethyl ester cyclase
MPVMAAKIVLFQPSYETSEVSPPLALIAVAGPLVKAGHDVVIVDAALHADFVGRTLAALDGALCLGVSIITGPMIRDTIAVCQAAKARYPDLTIVLGGWHPSILPEQTVMAAFVDVVLTGQGEVSLRELVDRLQGGDSLDGLPGAFWKQDGQVQQGPDRPITGVAHLPDRIPGYALVDHDAYARRTGLRWLMYSTSHGCPYDCSYCSNASVYGRRLDELPAEQVIDEIGFLVRTYGVRLLGLIDDIFFTFRDRSKRIAEGLIRNNIKVDWYVQDRADSVAKLSTEDAAMYRRAGLRRIHFGAESGSDRVLRSIEKRSNVQRTLAAVDRCAAAGIRSSFGFIFGLPDEEEEDLRQTVALIAEIYRRSPMADCHTNIFTPYPGSPLWPRSVELGVEAPARFEDWIDFFPRVTELPWLKGPAHKRLQDIRQYLRFGYPNMAVGEAGGSLAHQLAVRTLGPSARWRLDNHRYGLPVEVRGFAALRKLRADIAVTDRF